MAGIPKFYRWISERYPLINQPVSATGCPEMDNLYLDMNGIIHTCRYETGCVGEYILYFI